MMRLFNWFRRRSLERGLDRELQYHFDRRVAVQFTVFPFAYSAKEAAISPAEASTTSASAWPRPK